MAAESANHKRVVLTVEVQVTDEKELLEYAEQRYRKCWGDQPIDPPLELADAVMEALVISNENPEPSAYGIEIVKSDAVEVEG